MKTITVKQNHSQYLHHLSGKRIKKIGEGAYAKVFQHPTHKDVVVKVFTDVDASYLKYIQWCEKNQHNPYVPKLKGELVKCIHHPSKKDIEIYGAFPSVYYIVFLEKLKSLSTEETSMAHYDNIIASLFGHQIVKKISQSYCAKDNYYKWAKPYQLIRKSMSKNDKNNHLKNWFNFIESNFNSKHFDLHENNIMLRGFQPVFTDAVC